MALAFTGNGFAFNEVGNCLAILFILRGSCERSCEEMQLLVVRDWFVYFAREPMGNVL